MLRYMYKENEDDFVEHELERSVICEYLNIDFIARACPNETIDGHSYDEEMMLIHETVDLVLDNGQEVKECPAFVEHSRTEIDFEFELFLVRSRKWLEDHDPYVPGSKLPSKK